MNTKMQQIVPRARIHDYANSQGRTAKTDRDSNELEATVWVMIGVLLALILLAGYLLWTKA